MDAVRATAQYGRDRASQAGKQISFTLTTNALSLGEQVRDYLAAEGTALSSV